MALVKVAFSLPHNPLVLGSSPSCPIPLKPFDLGHKQHLLDALLIIVHLARLAGEEADRASSASCL